jgi:predicted metal-dependent hydrolase
VTTLLSLVSDLFFSVQIQNAAQVLGWESVNIEDPAQINSQPPLQGQHLAPTASQNSALGHDLIAYLVELAPSLIVVELSSQTLPWEQWLVAIKTSPATRRIPALGFGPHVDEALRARAKDVGCDVVVTKGQFTNRMVDILRENARIIDPAEAQAAAQGELSELARKGIDLFNKGEYFEAHEELEHAWNAETGPVRNLYQGILQIAVAYLQITRRNYNGAIKIFLRSRQWLDPLPAISRGVDVATLRHDAAQVRQTLEALGPDRIQEFDLKQLQPVKLVTPS